MSIYLVKFDGKKLLLKASSKMQASSVGFHIICEEYDYEPERLAQLGFPDETDIVELPELEEAYQPVLID